MITRKKDSSGFTLIEIMVVVVILGILAAIVTPKIMSRPDEARAIKAKQDIRSLSSALNLYRLDTFSYPSTNQGLQALITRPADLPSNANWRAEGYIEKMPVDPWGRPYLYLYPGIQGQYDLFTYGADGVEGGGDSGKDIGSWMLD